MLTGYVDDGRQGGTTLRRGMMFDSDVGEFVFSETQLRKDEDENETDNIRMKKRCLQQ